MNLNDYRNFNLEELKDIMLDEEDEHLHNIKIIKTNKKKFFVDDVVNYSKKETIVNNKETVDNQN